MSLHLFGLFFLGITPKGLQWICAACGGETYLDYSPFSHLVL